MSAWGVRVALSFVCILLGLAVLGGHAPIQLNGWPPNNWSLSSLTVVPDTTVARWLAIAEDEDQWSYGLSQGNNCATIKERTIASLKADTFYYGDSNGWKEGEHVSISGMHRIVLDSSMHDSDRSMYETVMHEGRHHPNRPGHEHFNRWTLYRCHDYATRNEEDDDSDGGAGGGGNDFVLTPNEALACSTLEGEGTYCASLTIELPYRCWSGTITIAHPNGDHAAVTFTYSDTECTGQATFDYVCRIPYEWWIEFCW